MEFWLKKDRKSVLWLVLYSTLTVASSGSMHRTVCRALRLLCRKAASTTGAAHTSASVSVSTSNAKHWIV